MPGALAGIDARPLQRDNLALQAHLHSPEGDDIMIGLFHLQVGEARVRTEEFERLRDRRRLARDHGVDALFRQQGSCRAGRAFDSLRARELAARDNPAAPQIYKKAAMRIFLFISLNQLAWKRILGLAPPLCAGEVRVGALLWYN